MELVQEYTQTEIGLIPSDWEIKSLGECLKIKHGKDQKSIEDKNGKYPILGTGGLMNYTNSYLYDKPTVLIGRKGTIDKPQFMDTPFWTVDTLFYSEVSKNYSPKFLYYNFLLIDWYSYNEASGVPSLNAKTIEKILIPVPTLEEQTLIATALSNADNWITNLDNLLIKKRQIKQGALQELLKPKESWEVKKLGNVGECIIGLTYSPGNVVSEGKLVLRASNVKENKLVYSDTVFVNVEVSEKLITRKGDILICVRNGSRNLIGKCAYIDGRGVGETFGAFMSVFRSNYNAYIFQVFQSNIIKKQIEEHLGATINQITNKSLNSFQIPFPTIKEQEYIVAILSDMDAEIEQLETKLEKAKKVKQGMMQELLTGKTRLV
ncbi:restriction endonuclease subunit S [Flavobacterium sp.]|uniref:restriction endonuclease subunit S n=1 Tax=Flavobacterium sp. TaxID=239 RepID=UPI0037532CF9